jgi:hypothetical protein
MRFRPIMGIAGMFLILASTPAMATHQGFDQTLFEDSNNNGVADGWTDVNSFDGEFTASEYLLDVDTTLKKQLITIRPAADNSGNAGIARTFSTSPGQQYNAAMTFTSTDVQDDVNFFARITLQPRSGGVNMGVTTECNAEVNVGRDAPTEEPPVQVLAIPSCTMPTGADEVRVKVRAQIRSASASGTLTIHEVSFHHLGSIN